MTIFDKLYNMQRPPRIYLNGNEKIIRSQRGCAYKIKSELPDEDLVEAIQSGYDKSDDEDDDDFYEEDEEETKIDPLSHDGLYNDEIDDIAEKIDLFANGYVGTFPVDHISRIAKVVKPNTSKFGFIFNTDRSDEKGKHWIACCYIANEQEFDYYDSLGGDPSEEFMTEIKPVIDALKLPYYLKFKINKIPRQDASQNCGYHALLFLHDMLVKGIAYKFASGYNAVRKGEGAVKSFKDEMKRFGYI